MKRGRGIDFEHRFRTSRWAEDLLVGSLRETKELVAVRFGLSEIRAERDLKYDKTNYKEPDLLVYDLGRLSTDEKQLVACGDWTNKDRTHFERGGTLRFSIDKALAALARIIHEFRNAKSLFVVQSRCERGFDANGEAFA